MLKRLPQIISGLALLNFAVLIGVIGFLTATGRLNAERINQIGEVLKGHWPEQNAAAVPTTLAADQAVDSSAKIRRDEQIAEMSRRQGDRFRRELQDQQNLLEAAQLALLRQREQFAAERKAWEQARQAWLRERNMDGFVKELDYLSSIKPKQAKELLRGKADADVVRLLMEMDTRKGRKIIDECKTSAEQQWIGTILEKIRQQNQAKGSSAAVAETTP